MNIYLLQPNPERRSADDPWCPPYNRAYGFVIKAKSEGQAREIASLEAGSEGTIAWLEEKHSTCKEITLSGEPEIIMIDSVND